MATALRSSCATSRTLQHAPSRRVVCVRAAADNQLLKKPELKKPEPKKLFGESEDAPASSASAEAAVGSSKAITVEYQRQRAKEMRQYFIEQKTEAMKNQSQVFGWTKKNEISNGRWVMFGFFVGMLTEYATGVDFPDQLKLMVSYLGIVDLD